MPQSARRNVGLRPLDALRKRYNNYETKISDALNSFFEEASTTSSTTKFQRKPLLKIQHPVHYRDIRHLSVRERDILWKDCKAYEEFFQKGFILQLFQR